VWQLDHIVLRLYEDSELRRVSTGGLEKGRNKAEFTRFGYFELRDSFGLSKMVRAFDMFDQSAFSKSFAYESRGCVNVYEIVLV